MAPALLVSHCNACLRADGFDLSIQSNHIKWYHNVNLHQVTSHHTLSYVMSYHIKSNSDYPSSQVWSCLTILCIVCGLMIFHHNTGGTTPRRSWTHPPRLFARHTEMSRPWGSSYNLGADVLRQFWATKSINSPNSTDGKMKNAGGNNGMLIHSQLKNGMAMRYESMLIGFPLSQCVAWICWTDTSQISNTDQLHRSKWNIPSKNHSKNKRIGFTGDDWVKFETALQQ